MRESVMYQEILREGELIGEQRGRLEGEQRGEQRGIIQGKQEIARNLLKQEMTVEQVVNLTGLSEEFVQNLVKEMTP
jgi:predicted transposase/invertase (TIGR01784 family)